MPTQLEQQFIDAYINYDEDEEAKIAVLGQSQPQLVAQHYYYSIVTDTMPVEVAITPKVYFDTKNGLYDQYMEPVSTILDPDGYETASSNYVLEDITDPIQAEKFLQSKGFVKSANFDNFLLNNMKMPKENLLSLQEVQNHFHIAIEYVAVLVQAGFVDGILGEKIEDFKVDKQSFQEWLEERKNGWRLPSPPDLLNLIEERKKINK